ncbi:hypothetical protein HYU13_02385 [Candidatus Woesearchaeota archaeon]|nr:hypothetical protein [Candidatus Woesearchaeota archaeon]
MITILKVWRLVKMNDYRSGYTEFVKFFREDYPRVEYQLFESAKVVIKTAMQRQKRQLEPFLVNAIADLTLESVLHHFDTITTGRGQKESSDFLRKRVARAANIYVNDYLENRGPEGDSNTDLEVLSARSRVWFSRAYAEEKGIASKIMPQPVEQPVKEVYAASARAMTPKEADVFGQMLTQRDSLDTRKRPGEKPREPIGIGDRRPRRTNNARRLRQ